MRKTKATKTKDTMKFVKAIESPEDIYTNMTWQDQPAKQHPLAATKELTQRLRDADITSALRNIADTTQSVAVQRWAQWLLADIEIMARGEPSDSMLIWMGYDI